MRRRSTRAGRGGSSTPWCVAEGGDGDAGGDVIGEGGAKEKDMIRRTMGKEDKEDYKRDTLLGGD
jgi:hypothetical protein